MMSDAQSFKNVNSPIGVNNEQESQHLLTGQRAANFRLLANQ